mgnify:CR=1 FL=1
MIWRGGRVVEGARLERVYSSNTIEGSNPSLSANNFLISLLIIFKYSNAHKNDYQSI